MPVDNDEVADEVVDTALGLLVLLIRRISRSGRHTESAANAQSRKGKC